jgi:hypothetical protein
MSARHSRPLRADWVDARAALDVVVSYIRASDKVMAIKEALIDAREAPEEHTLPGYNLFSRDPVTGIDALEWMVPEVRKDLDFILLAYDDFADRPLGKVGCPDRAARKVWATTSASRRYFGPSRSRFDWWVPAVKLVALAAKKSGAVPKVHGTHVTLDLGGQKLEVNSSRCWVNYANRFRHAEWPALDADIRHLTQPAMRTRHPLAQALLALDSPVGVQWAASAVIRAVNAGDLPPVTSDIFDKRTYTQPTSRKRKVRDTRGLDFAIASVRDYMQGDAEGVPTLEGAYRFLRPYVGAADFAKRVGSPYCGGRRITRNTANKMAALLNKLEGDGCSLEPDL